MPKPTGKKSKSGEPKRSADLCLAPVLDMRRARELKEMTMALLSQRRACCIDASKVERLSTGCLQVLVAFVMSMKTAGFDVTVTQPSPTFLSAFRDLGLSSVLEKFSLEPSKCEF